MPTTTPIPFKHWSHRVNTNAVADGLLNKDGYWGEIVTGLADIEQCIGIIAVTPRGSVPTEPDKFCDAKTFMDRPPAIAVPLITRAVFDALVQFEPRIVVERVEVEALSIYHFRLPIFWRPRADVLAEIRRTEVNLTADDQTIDLISNGVLA